MDTIGRAGVGWEVDPRPIMELGISEDPDYQFFEITSIARLGNGTIVVGDGSHRLRYYSPAGVLLRQFGGEGEGPGEFRSISGFDPYGGDGLIVFDHALQRATVVDSDGLAGTIDAPGSRPLRALGRLADGTWYGQGGAPVAPGRAGTLAEGATTYRFLGNGSRPDVSASTEIGTYAGETTATFEHDGEVGFRDAPFTPKPLFAAAGTCLVIATEDGLDFVASDGNRAAVSWRVPHRSTTDAHLEQWIGWVLSDVPEEARPRFRALLQAIPFPETLPAYNSLVVDALGYVWLQRYAPPAGPGEEWIVIDPARGVPHAITMPFVGQVFHIGENEIVAVVTDELDREVIKVFRLDRAGTGAGGPAGSLCLAAAPTAAQERMTLVEELRIGALDGPAALSRVASVVQSTDGRSVYVADARDQVIRIFDAGTGALVRTIGGVGGGPGEFRRIGALTFRADTLYAAGTGQRRIVVFTREGEHVDTRENPLFDRQPCDSELNPLFPLTP